MSEQIAVKPQPRTSAQRQQKYVARLKADGLKRMTLVLDGKTVQLMRDISREQGVTLADVVKLGALTAERELKALTQRKAMAE